MRLTEVASNDRIKQWLDKMDIRHYTINPNGVVDVAGGVFISHKSLIKIPIQFGTVDGDFDCGMNGLTTLEGSPKEVGRNFNCYFNKLTTLEGAPREVGMNCNVNNNKLTSLKGAPREVGKNFDCSNNRLLSLKGATTKVGRHFNCNDNRFKEEPDHSFIDIEGKFYWKL